MQEQGVEIQPNHMSPNFLSGVRHVVEEPSLFTDDVAARLEALRPQAGSCIGRAVLENVSLLSAEEANGFTIVQEPLKAALVDRAHRGARQVVSTVNQDFSTCGHRKFPHPWLITTMGRVPVGASMKRRVKRRTSRRSRASRASRSRHGRSMLCDLS